MPASLFALLQGTVSAGRVSIHAAAAPRYECSAKNFEHLEA